MGVRIAGGGAIPGSIPSILIPLLLWLVVMSAQAGRGLLPPAGGWEGSGTPAAVIQAVTMEEGNLLAGGPAGLFESPDGGVSWRKVDLGQGQLSVTAIAVDGGRAVVAGTGGLWQRTESGWTRFPVPSEAEVHQLLADGERLLAASEDGLYALSDGTTQWQRLWPRQVSPAAANFVHVAGSVTLIGTEDGVVELTADGTRSLGPRGARVLGIDSGGGWVYIAVAEPHGGLFRARAGSSDWEQGRVQSQNGAAVMVDKRDPKHVYAGLGGLADGRYIAGVVASSDYGATWDPVRTRLLNSFVPSLALDTRNGVLYAGTNGGGLLRYREPAPIRTMLDALDPFLGFANPVLLGYLALVLFLRRRGARLKPRQPGSA